MRVAHITGFYKEGLGYEENYLGFFQASLGAHVSIITTTLACSNMAGAKIIFKRTRKIWHVDKQFRT